MANLINNGILPLTFENEKDYEDIDALDELFIADIESQVNNGNVVVENKTKGNKYNMLLNVTERQKQMLIHGGLLNLTKVQAEGSGNHGA